MKILQIHHSLNIGGVESMVCALSNELVKQNDVTICTYYDLLPGEGLEPVLSKDVKRISLHNKALTPLTKIIDMFRLVHVILSGNYDVVHVHGAFNFYILAILFKRKSTSFFYTVHSDAKKENGPMSNFMFPIKKYFFSRKNVVPITISPESQRSFAELYHCESELVLNGVVAPVVSNNPNIIDEYAQKENCRPFIHVGRICEAKNQLVLCRVFDRLIKEGYNVMLVIVGPNADDNIFAQLKPFFCNQIVFLDARNDVAELMSHSEALCLPSIYEGLPVTLLEALSVGCVPICSPIGGMKNVVRDGVNGLLSASPDEDDYYHAMRRYLELSDDDINRIRNNVKNSFNDYCIVKTAQQYYSVYQKYNIKK